MNETKRVWIVTTHVNGFTGKVLVEATETGLRSYLHTEVVGWTNYSGASEAEVLAAKVLHLPIYIYK